MSISSIASSGLCLDLGPDCNPIASLRSHSSMRGLTQAELGLSMVELDNTGHGSGFREGQRIVMAAMSPLPTSSSSRTPVNPTLSRHGTLLTVGASPARNVAELKSILGNANSRLKAGAAILLPPGQLSSAETSLEQAKPRARVEVDISLQSNSCVQGGYLGGHVKIRVRKRSKKEAAVKLAGGKVRVIGFECINESHRHMFYQCSAALSEVTTTSDQMLSGLPDAEGFAFVHEGIHALPFAMFLPVEGDSSKGVFPSYSGAAVRYIVMVSVKVQEPQLGMRSIAHFYRDCEIWPRLNPSIILAPAPTPFQATTSKSLFMGGSGQVSLTATLHRLYWVAGQQCYVAIHVKNSSKKTLKSLTLTLFRSTVTFKPYSQPKLDSGVEHDPDDCQTSTSQKQVAETTLEMAQCGARGHASAKGWFQGIAPGHAMDFAHSILLPSDALSVTRSRLLEVEYNIRVSISAGTLTPDVEVALPIKIINFLSLDPPPSNPLPSPAVPIISADPRHRNSRPDISDIFGTSRSGRRLESLSESDDEYPTEEVEGESVENTNDGGEGQPEFEVTGQLGNLSINEDTDEVVQHAITSAMIDTKYGQYAGRFADLYYHDPVSDELCDLELHPEPTSIVDDIPSVTLKPEDIPSATPKPDLPSTSHFKGPSTFAQRVQEKLQVAGEQGRLSHGRDEETLLPSDSVDDIALLPTRGSYFRPREHIPDQVEPDSPLRSSIIHRDSSSSSTPSFDFDPKSSQTSLESQTTVDSVEHLSKLSGSRVLPVPSISSTNFDSSPNQYPSGRPRAQSMAGPRSVEDILPRTRAKSTCNETAPFIKDLGLGGNTGTNSVKDRIRQLEQRVQASGGPL